MLLEMQQVRVEVRTMDGSRNLLDLSELSIDTGESVGVVGETGSGKTMASLAITRLFPTPAIALKSGSIQFAGQELAKRSMNDMERLRGRQIAMIFQDPSTSLNPVFRVGRILTDLVRKHHKVGVKEAKRRVIELLHRVELPNPEEMAQRYPFELSGGQRQRIMIAMALVGRPKLLIADEPTTALDVTVQAGILSLLRRLQQEESLSMLVITHNLGLVAHMTHRIYVMYEGKVVETGDTASILTRPAHPYTQMLLKSVPRWETRRTKLATAPTVQPDRTGPLKGCSFAPRCPIVTKACRETVPELRAVPSGTQRAACIRLEESYDAVADS